MKEKEYQKYMEDEIAREEILKHKWIESEKKGYDIGLESAAAEWSEKYGSSWEKIRRTRPSKKNKEESFDFKNKQKRRK